jgi:predicted Zn-dependent protease
MYVGVTEADIYTGETNYVFTSGWRQGELAAAISSYARMKSAASSEQYESRKRLIGKRPGNTVLTQTMNAANRRTAAG